MKIDCGREQDAIDAVASARWPERCDDELRSHIASCEICSDLVAVLGPVTAERESAWAEARVPPADVTWWRARIRAREEAIRAAARPLNAITAAALLFFGALAGGLLVALLPQLRAWMGAVTTSVELPNPAQIASLFAPIAGSSAALVALGTSLLLGPLALWFALRDDG